MKRDSWLRVIHYLSDQDLHAALSLIQGLTMILSEPKPGQDFKRSINLPTKNLEVGIILV